MKVLLTGASGFIGQSLGKVLVNRAHQVVALMRRPDPSRLSYECEVFPWDGSQQRIPQEALAGVEGVIHLAGEPIAGSRWNKQVKERIVESRTLGTKNLVDSINEISSVKTLVSASAVGIYGDRSDEELVEDSSLGQGFIPDLCKSWESEAQKFHHRSVCLRIGIVMGQGGGALEKMLPPFKMGVGAPLGSGQQYMPWIHRDDLIQLILWSLENPQVEGPINAVGPQPLTNTEVSKVLARHLGRWLLPPVPPFVLQVMYGEMAQILTQSQRVLPKKAIEMGFQFQYSDLETVFKNVIPSH